MRFTARAAPTFIEKLGFPVTDGGRNAHPVVPASSDGRVKTLHPAVFGGSLARREPNHLGQLEQYGIPQIDCVIVGSISVRNGGIDLRSSGREIIEKIDIGGVSLIRAAAKNFNDVAVVASKEEYPLFLAMSNENGASLRVEDRRELARRAFGSEFELRYRHF